MTAALFIRHAETDMSGAFCGHSDPPLNEAGRRQLAQLLDTLEGESIDAIYTSDLIRAKSTAEAISEKFRVPCTVERNLRELNFGRWEGLTWQEVESLDYGFAQRWMKKFPKVDAPDGESFDRFESRILNQISYIFEASQRRRVAIVTHGGVMRVVLQSMCYLNERAAWDLTKPYCSFFRYPYRTTP